MQDVRPAVTMPWLTKNFAGGRTTRSRSAPGWTRTQQRQGDGRAPSRGGATGPDPVRTAGGTARGSPESSAGGPRIIRPCCSCSTSGTRNVTVGLVRARRAGARRGAPRPVPRDRRTSSSCSSTASLGLDGRELRRRRCDRGAPRSCRRSRRALETVAGRARSPRPRRRGRAPCRSRSASTGRSRSAPTGSSTPSPSPASTATPAVVADCGTATTFDAVGADGAFLGGAIAPGLELGLEALAARTAKLPPGRAADARIAPSAATRCRRSRPVPSSATGRS